ncbi:ABC transporter permease [Aliiglaciecola sp. LCG003]|uniref:ABC transporter permease n=1 Tax=Aliiglaciecola sp. LCG003 TaxID=3053655 RepID=UPI0025741F95|nr:ABC transporter permease [Aliiglaciecola sp. LCG003]WJG08745.1 ABC transporter permease [Aliiglaciecola sp. LCG003]
MSWLLLLSNEVKLQWFDMRQYWFETVTSLTVMCVMFIGLFLGVKSFLLESPEGTSLDGLLFGFLLWSYATTCYMTSTRTVVEDTQKGYLEQLFLCPKGFTSILFAKALVDVTLGLLYTTIFAYLTMWLTGNWIDINFALFYAALLLGAPSLIGLGLIVSGLALVFKRVETVGQILTLFLIGLVAIDGLPIGPASLLPFTPSVSLARGWVLEHSVFSASDILLVVANSAIYFAIGILVFKKAEKIAKRKNLIGQY